jgi:hypothetical protein
VMRKDRGKIPVIRKHSLRADCASILGSRDARVRIC